MSVYAIALVCLQAFLIQTVFSQAINLNGGVVTNTLNPGFNYGGLGNAGLVSNGLNSVGFGVPDVAAVSSVPVGGPLVSNGEAEMAVGGEFVASGTAAVAGQIPVIGTVSFGGQIPASGVVSIAGNCGCANLPL